MITALVGRLAATSTVTTLVSTRMYPNHLPQNRTRDFAANVRLPAIVYQQISNPEASAGSLELYEPRVQFDCWGRTYLEAGNLADAVVASLHGWRSNVNNILNVRLANRLDDYDPDIDSHRVILDFIVRYLLCPGGE